MTDEIRVERATDGARFLASDQLVWFDGLSPEPLADQLLGVPEDQRFAVSVVGTDADPATYPGIYGVRPMQLSVPDGTGAGRAVAVAGLTWVGVHPDHRRRGLLTAMLRHHFEQARADGWSLSALHASEAGIYGRHGYGLASVEYEVETGRGTTFVAPGLEAEVATIATRLGTITDEGMAERRRRIDLDGLTTNVGTIVGDADFYTRMMTVRADQTLQSEPPRIMIALRDGRDVGYAVFKRIAKWPRSRPSGEVDVWQLSGAPAVRLALLRRLTDLDLTGTVKVNGISPADPLLSWVTGPRGLSAINPVDSLWVRLVDLPGAIAARGYEGEGDVVVEVDDATAPWNAGRWRLSIGGGTGEAVRSDDEAEVSLSAAALGASYLGSGNLAEMGRAGTLTEHRPGAVRALWQALRTATGPYAASGF